VTDKANYARSMSEIAAKAIDDFGARTSSLRCSQRLPVDQIKVDSMGRAWVRLETVMQVNNSKRVNLRDE
jgi:EAL domain-containing protein (putative c-di-GMP-specific phosphodiesterase class I)